MFKIKFRSPTIDDHTLFFTTDEYAVEGTLITFTDKYGTTQTWNTAFLINIERVEA